MSTTEIDVAKLQMGLRHVEEQVSDLVDIQRSISESLQRLSSTHEEVAELKQETHELSTRLRALELNRPVTDLTSGIVLKVMVGLAAGMFALAFALIKGIAGV